MLWPASRALLGQDAPLASASSRRMSMAAPKRAVRNVNGSASGVAYLATMKPLDHSSAKVSGAARMRKCVKDGDELGSGMRRGQCPIRLVDARGSSRAREIPHSLVARHAH